MAYSVLDASAFEERRKPIARELGAGAIRLSQFDNVPGQGVAGPEGLGYLVVGAKL